MDSSAVQFDENTMRPAREGGALGVGGVVRLRSRSKSLGIKGDGDGAKITELEEAEDEDAGLRDERDFKRSQVCFLLLCGLMRHMLTMK